MRIVWILVLLCAAFGCSQAERPAPTDTSAEQGRPAEQAGPSVTLDNLVYGHPSLATTQHPLVCGAGGDFPNGRELFFWNPQSQESVHAVFPKGITAPENLDGKFVLHGRFQAIQNRNRYNTGKKRPPEDYRYLVVSSWEYMK